MEEGTLQAHWEASQAWVPASESPNGRTLVQGATEVRRHDLTEENRAIAGEFLTVVLGEGHYDRMPEYIGSSYLQYNPAIQDHAQGTANYLASVQAAGNVIAVTNTEYLIAEGNFVLAASEGYFGASESDYAIFYDLFQVEAGKLVAHWDVIPTLPSLDELPHDNGFL